MLIKSFVHFGNIIKEIEKLNPNTTILTGSKFTETVLCRIFPERNIKRNKQIDSTNLTEHSSSEYWNWSNSEFVPQFNKCVTVSSLFKTPTIDTGEQYDIWR